MKKNKILFSITKKDFEVQFFCAGGKGGQRQNKVATACRIIHKDSGARAESRSHRMQHQNKKEALRRLIKTQKFKKWIKVECAIREEGYRNIEQKIENLMCPKNLKIEYLGEK